MKLCIVLYICVGIFIFIFVYIISNMYMFHYKEHYEKRKRKNEEKRKKKQKEKYSKITLDNKLLNSITSNRFIVFKGGLGKGKTIMMNLVSHFLVKKRTMENTRNARYLKYMQPNRINVEKLLIKNKCLPIYSNIDFIDEKKFRNQELLPYLCLQKKAVNQSIFCIDEISSLFPKEMYYETVGRESPTLKGVKELFKKNRHYTNGWFLATEQDGNDIFIGFRKNGYALIECLGTIVQISKFGKFKKTLHNIKIFTLPAFFTINYARVFNQCLFFNEKVKVIFKLFLPSFFSLPKEYYTQKLEFNNIINYKYQRFLTRFQYQTGEYIIRYTNNDLFQYDTRFYKSEYDKLFNKNGDRVYYVNEE